MVPIQPANRVALVTALLQAVHVGISEVPAARALHDIPADRTEITNLRRGRFACRLRNRGELRAHRGVLRDFAELRRSAETQLTRRPYLDSAKTLEPLQIHQRRRRNDILLGKIEHIHAARKRHMSVLRQKPRSTHEISRRNYLKSIHRKSRGQPLHPWQEGLLLSALTTSNRREALYLSGCRHRGSVKPTVGFTSESSLPLML